MLQKLKNKCTELKNKCAVFENRCTALKKGCTALMRSQKGVGTIEIVLILVVLIALVIIFRRSITSLLETIFGQINSDAAQVYNPTAG